MNCRFYTNAEAANQRLMLGPLFDVMLTRTPCRDFGIEDLFRLAAQGRAVIGAVYEDGKPVLVGAFEFRHYPKAMAVNIMALGGGRMNEAMDAFWPQFRDWCREMGASRIEASCAPAMTRLLCRAGFEHTSNNVMQAL